MDDLVERLREWAGVKGPFYTKYEREVFVEVADELTRRRASEAALRSALEKARWLDSLDLDTELPDQDGIVEGIRALKHPEPKG